MSNIQFPSITPIFRIYDIPKADAFYVDYLGFTIDWDHRFPPNEDGVPFPLYRQVSRGSLVLHLSEHHGDGSPGAHVRVKISAGGLAEFHAELESKKYGYMRPAIEDGPVPGLKEVRVIDPFGNRITFYEEQSEQSQ